MAIPTTINSLKSAISTLQNVVNDLNHPDEDVIALSGCHYSRQAINQFLHAFLESKSADFNKTDSMDNLVAICANYEPRFKTLDMSCFGCKHMASDDASQKHCFCLIKVNDCFDRACKVKNIVLANLNVTEDELMA